MKISDDGKVTFESTGLEASAHRGIIGISPDLRIFEGYDTAFLLGDDLKPEERRELAEFMIERWRRFGGI
jgi:hypothetical protein